MFVFAAALSACGGGGDAAGPVVLKPTVTSIAVSSSAASVIVGQSQSFTAEARDQNGAVMTGVPFTWASSNGAVASVADGVATGVAAGTAVITASSGGVTSNAVSITVAMLANGSVTVDKASVFFTANGQSATLIAQVLDAQGAPAPGAVTWTSSAPDKVSIDGTGRLVANAVGSAQIVAESGGLKSTPTLVIVAVPQAGALLVTDAQVVSVSAPAAAASGTPAGVGSQYDVTLQGVAAPAPGTVMIAAESAPIAGTVVATRQDTTGLVVTLAIAPLYQLFSAYDISLDIDLSGFAIEAIPAQATLAAARGLVWARGQQSGPRALATARPLDVLDPFKAWRCDKSITAKLVGEPPLQLALENTLHLVLDDRPGYSKQALEGSLLIHAKAGIKLSAGFEAEGRCDAQGQVKVKAFGWLSVLVMPAVRVGLGAEIKGKILLVQGELGVDGTVGVSGVMGWECGGASPDCRGLNTLTPVRDLATKSSFPADNGIQVFVSGQFYAIAGLDASIFLGALNAGIVEARIGPKQSFDLAREKDQAARADYASSYDLKLEGVVEPGPALKEAIEKVINSSVTGVKFEANFHRDLSESPKGNLSVSATRVALGKAVDFTVDFTPPSSVDYFLLGYNVTGVELYRKRDDEIEFTPWKSMNITSSHATQATYHWQTGASDAGNYQFAAFVNTQIPTPLLEVAPNSVQSVEVSCFSAGAAAAGSPSRARAQAAGGGKAGPLANVCADTWAGTSSISAPNFYSASANVVWTADPTYQGQPNEVKYFAEGSVDIAIEGYPAGCTSSPTHFTFDRNTPLAETNLIVDFSSSPPTYSGSARTFHEITVTCPNNQVFKATGYRQWFVGGGYAVNDGLVIDISGDTGPYPGATYNFSRP